MRRFNYKDVFEKFFPYYFKENDSYKDREGKGLLERLVTTCTEYIDTDIVTNPYNPGLDNFLDIIDIEKSPEIFLNYLWEYLGEIPYAWGVITDGKPYTQENLLQWIKSSNGYPRANPRQVLKYAISLYKIRGTNKFYNILGNIYGVKFDLIDYVTKGHILKDEYIKATFPEEDEGIYSSYPSDDDPQGISSQYPLYQYTGKEDCNKCVDITLDVYVPGNIYEYILNNPEGEASIKYAFLRVVEKYLPIFCRIRTKEDGSYDINLKDGSPILIIRN